jgi:hypothetical protein
MSCFPKPKKSDGRRPDQTKIRIKPIAFQNLSPQFCKNVFLLIIKRKIRKYSDIGRKFFFSLFKQAKGIEPNFPGFAHKAKRSGLETEFPGSFKLLKILAPVIGIEPTT